jgi:hypothetical protein
VLHNACCPTLSPERFMAETPAHRARLICSEEAAQLRDWAAAQGARSIRAFRSCLRCVGDSSLDFDMGGEPLRLWHSFKARRRAFKAGEASGIATPV